MLGCRWSIPYFMAVILQSAKFLFINSSSEKAFARVKMFYWLLRWKKAGENKEKSFHRCIMQSKNCIQHNLYFYTANSSIRSCHFPSLFRVLSSRAHARNIHKTFIYCNWCFQWWNTKSFYDFSNSIFYNCRYVILHFSLTLVLVCHTWECFFGASQKKRKLAQNIKYLHMPYRWVK